MSLADLLRTRQAEHDALLQRVVALLQEDERVVAAWLFGSWGRHTADELSDTDLWVVVSDEHIDAFKQGRKEYIARVGEPLLILEHPSNAPPHGAYLMVLYPGHAGGHHVDWYWQPQSDASIPQHAVVLFNRGAIPRDARLEQLDSPPMTPRERADKVAHLVAFFWEMSNIAVKGTVRHFVTWEATRTALMLRGMLDEVKRLVGVSTTRPSQEEWRTTFHPPSHPGEHIALLRATAHEMEAMTPHIEAIGARVPMAAIPYIYDFFDLAQLMIEATASGDLGR
jgi:predicted nucleotidyltransferase